MQQSIYSNQTDGPICEYQAEGSDGSVPSKSLNNRNASLATDFVCAQTYRSNMRLEGISGAGECCSYYLPTVRPDFVLLNPKDLKS